MHSFRRVLLLAMTVLALAACAPEPPDTAADEAALKAGPPAWFEAYNAGNAEAMAKLYADNAILMPPDSPAVAGRAAIRDYLASDIEQARAGGLVVSGAEITGTGVAGDTGWVSGTFTVTDGAGAIAASGKYLTVSRRSGNGWHLDRDIWNTDAPATPPAPGVPVDEVFAD